MLLSSIATDLAVTIDSPTVAFNATHESAVGIVWDDSNQLSFATAGTWLIRNAIVDYDNKVGPWSQPLTLNLPLGWLLMGCDRNLPDHPSRMGVIWKATNNDTNDEIWLVEGQRNGYSKFAQFQDPYDPNGPDGSAPYPFSTNNPDPYPLTMHDRGNASLPIYPSKILVGIDTPAAPSAWACLHSLDACDVAYSFVTISGETDRSPTTSLAAKSAGKVGFRRLYFASGFTMQQGVLGIYVYKKIGGVWKRQLAAPWLADGVGPDKYLYGIHDQQIILWTDHDGPEHSATPGGAWSILSPLEQAHKTSAASIIIDTTAYIYNPLIEPVKSVRNRTVAAPGNGGWFIEKRSTVPAVGGHTPANDHPVYWPMLVVCNDELQATAWYGMSFLDDTSRGPGSSFAVTVRDDSGGQAFKTRFFDCYFSLGGLGTWPFIKEGLHIGWECSATAGQHTASEWLLERCSFYGHIGIRLEGTQTVNMRFNTTHILGVPASLIIVDGCNVAFKAGLYTSRIKTLFHAGWIASIYVDEGFNDQSDNGTLVDYNSRQHRKIEINRFVTRGFYRISRRPVGREPMKLVLRDWEYQPSAEPGIVYEVSPDRMKIDLVGSESLAPKITVKQPSQAEFQYRSGVVSTPPQPPPTGIPSPSPGGT